MGSELKVKLLATAIAGAVCAAQIHETAGRSGIGLVHRRHRAHLEPMLLG